MPLNASQAGYFNFHIRLHSLCIHLFKSEIFKNQKELKTIFAYQRIFRERFFEISKENH